MGNNNVIKCSKINIQQIQKLRSYEGCRIHRNNLGIYFVLTLALH